MPINLYHVYKLLLTNANLCRVDNKCCIHWWDTNITEPISYYANSSDGKIYDKYGVFK